MKKKIIVLSFFSLLMIGGASTVFAIYGIQTKIINCVANQTLQDPACTPGAVLTTSTTTICKTGYTTTVRDVSVATKKKVFKEYGIDYSLHSNYEVDHLISLELGGSNDISNLFPESYLIKDNARIKDKLENYLHSKVCSGKMSITEAQKEISTNWLYYYDLYYNVKVATTSKSVLPATTTSIVPTKSIATSSTNFPSVKKSLTGLCHALGTRYYTQTLNYTGYNSIGACLASGGKLPK